jgi:hypothetical protein
MVSTELFCRVWNASRSGAEAARVLGMEPRSAKTTATRLRKKGLALKKFTTLCGRRPGKPVEVEKINALLKADAEAGVTVEELVKEQP